MKIAKERLRGMGLLALMLASVPQLILAAGFDCTKAASKAEKLICADTELSRLDDDLASAFRQARRSSLSDRLAQDQRGWIAKRDACPDKDPNHARGFPGGEPDTVGDDCFSPIPSLRIFSHRFLRLIPSP